MMEVEEEHTSLVRRNLHDLVGYLHEGIYQLGHVIEIFRPPSLRQILAQYGRIQIILSGTLLIEGASSTPGPILLLLFFLAVLLSFSPMIRFLPLAFAADCIVGRRCVTRRECKKIGSWSRSAIHSRCLYAFVQTQTHSQLSFIQMRIGAVSVYVGLKMPHCLKCYVHIIRTGIQKKSFQRNCGRTIQQKNTNEEGQLVLCIEIGIRKTKGRGTIIAEDRTVLHVWKRNIGDCKGSPSLHYCGNTC